MFLDTNGNGTLDSGEALAGIDVTFTIDGTPTTITTNATGTATLTGILAGTTVTIDIDDTTLPAGSVLTVGTDPTNVVVVANTTVTDTTGYEPRGDASEIVFLDSNGNGTARPRRSTLRRRRDRHDRRHPHHLHHRRNGTVTVTGILAGTTVTFDIDTTDTDFPTGAVLTVGTDPTDVVVVANTTITDTTGYEPQGDSRRDRVPRRQRQRHASTPAKHSPTST